MKMMVLLFLLSIALCSCEDEEGDTQTFLFLGHTYNWQDENRLDPRLEWLNYEQYTGVWLGGDVLARTLQHSSNFAYLDQFFRLKNPHTHWARGNHDEMESDSLLWLVQHTGRPGFYLHCENKLCVLVLNTNLVYHPVWGHPNDRCEERMNQWNLIQQIGDTLQEAAHLIVLHHHTFPILDTPQLAKRYNVVPARYLLTCDTNLTYQQHFYPLLQQITDRGIEVYMVGGDFGTRGKYLEHQSTDGITWLGAGLNNTVDQRYAPDYVTNFAADSVLIFQYQTTDHHLSWYFQPLQQLLEEHTGEAYLNLPTSIRDLR